ncbi:MAG TPA: oligoribonuclease [Candidatus Saccharimonadales bacterium]|nr:oligoribonuclease [Candidatus Saccharimonadales bacterium]
MIDKHARPTKLLWVDLEMTGLDPAKDILLEVAAVVTDFNFQPLVSYEAIIRQDPEVVRLHMKQNSWWEEYSANRDEFLQKTPNGKPSPQVEQEILSIIEQQFKSEPVILAGNSVHMDRAFIGHNWPVFYQKLHYRMLDVSAFKIVMRGKYDIEYEKKESHRALADIHESIAELQHYLKWFKEHPENILH